MIATKNVMNAMRTTRTELKANKDDSKTKVYAQQFVNNLGSLCNDAQKQIAILKGLEAGNIKGESGEEGMQINYYEILSEKMKNELGGIVKCCSKVLSLASKRGGSTTKLSDTAWDNVNMSVKNLAHKLIIQGENEDQLVVLAKLMDIKDALYS